MKIRKPENQKIVYIIPSKFVKLMKQTGPTCSAKKNSSSNSTSSSSHKKDLEPGPWKWVGLQDQNEKSTEIIFPNTSSKPPELSITPNPLLSPTSNVTPNPMTTSITPKNKNLPDTITPITTGTPTTQNRTEFTTFPVNNEPVGAVMDSSTDKTTKKPSFFDFFRNKPDSTTLQPDIGSPKSIQTSPTSKLPVPQTTTGQEEKTTTKDVEKTMSRTSSEKPTTKPIEYTTSQQMKQETTKSIEQTTQKPAGKCVEWYNKIKDDSKSSLDSKTEKNDCLKWYNLIKENGRKQSKLCTFANKSGFYRKRSDSRIDRWLDERSGIEFLEPIFSRTIVASNPFSQFLTTRQFSPKRLSQGGNIFDQAIQEKIRTLKWLDSKITSQYEMLSRIEEMSRTSVSISTSKRSNMRRMSKGKYSRRSTRAQRFRDEFIKKKMKRMSFDKSDGWWKNFNAKIINDREQQNDGFNLSEKEKSFVF